MSTDGGETQEMTCLEDVAREIVAQLRKRTDSEALLWTTEANSGVPVSILYLDGIEPLELVFTKLPSLELILNVHFDQLTLAEWRFNGSLELQRSDIRARGWAQQILVMQLLLMHSWLVGIDAEKPPNMSLSESWQYVVAGMSQLFAKHVTDFWLEVCGEPLDVKSQKPRRMLALAHYDEPGSEPPPGSE